MVRKNPILLKIELFFRGTITPNRVKEKEERVKEKSKGKE